MSQVARRGIQGGDGLALVMAVVPAAAALSYLGSRRPAVAMLAIAAAALALLALARIEVALYLLVATVPLEGLFQLRGNQALSLSKLAGGLAAVSFLFWVVSRGPRLHFDRLHALLFALLGLTMVSTLQARSVSRAADVTLRYAGFVVLSVIVSQVVTNPAVITKLVWVMSLSCAVTSVVGLERYFSGVAFAASVPHHTPGDLAYIVATTLPLTFLLLNGRPFQRAVVVVVIAVMLAAVVLSLSRGALLGLAAGVVWHVATHPRHLKVLLAGAFVGGLATYALVSLNQQHFDQSVEFKNKVAQENVDSRVLLWRSASRLAADHPLLGVGPGNFSEHFYEVTDNPLGVRNLLVVHNAFLDIAAEVGLLALVVFALYVLTAFSRLSTAVRAGAGPPGYAAAVRTALVVAVVAALTMSEQFFAPIWLLGGLTSPLWREATRDRVLV